MHIVTDEKRRAIEKKRNEVIQWIKNRMKVSLQWEKEKRTKGLNERISVQFAFVRDRRVFFSSSTCVFFNMFETYTKDALCFITVCANNNGEKTI